MYETASRAHLRPRRRVNVRRVPMGEPIAEDIGAKVIRNFAVRFTPDTPEGAGSASLSMTGTGAREGFRLDVLAREKGGAVRVLRLDGFAREDGSIVIQLNGETIHEGKR